MSERREGVQRVPRSGGRTTERGTGDIRRTPVGAGTRAAGARVGGTRVGGARVDTGARADSIGVGGAGVGGAGVGGAGVGGAEREAVSGARGARRYPTQGSAALKLDAAQPVRGTDDVAPEPRLRVAPPAPVTAPRAPFVAVVIALVVAGVFGILLINTKTNENTFQIDGLRDQKAQLDSQQRNLEAKLTEFNNPGNLRAMAKKLGLVESDSFAYIRLPDGKVILVPKPATSRPAITFQESDAPATSGDAPATSGGVPAQGNGVPAQGNGAPAQGNGAPAEGAGVPAQGAGSGTVQGGDTAQGTGR